ncbi:MAG: PAS domain-containing sensor histidine kinase [Bacteroidota bacterium]
METINLQDVFQSGDGFRALVQYATIGILLVDEQGNIVYVNPQGEQLFGYSKEELLFKRVEELIPDELRDSHKFHRSGYQKSPRPRQMGLGLELWAQRKDGSRFPVEISLSHFEFQEKKWVITFVNDISKRKRAEEIEKRYAEELEMEVKSRTKTLAQSLDKLIQLNKLKSRFVSLASHEFRTPLSTILTSVSLIGKYNREDQLEKRNKHIDRIKSSVKMMTHLLEDFLSLDKLNQGKLKSEPVAFDLLDIFHEVRDELENVLKSGQEIVIELTQKSTVCMDKRLVKNILMNLGSNAIKYSPEHAPITLEARVEENEVHLKVKDQGIGIPQKDQAKLFQMFHRASNVTHIKGTGLGLNIVKKYVDLLEGEIILKSLEGEGSTFHLRLPQASSSSNN